MTHDTDAVMLGSLVTAVRAKNAGPFKVTIDIFAGNPDVYAHIRTQLDTAIIAELLQVPLNDLQRFELDDLWVLKFSFPRPVVQGSVRDRDMHGAQFAWLLHELPIARPVTHP